MLDLIVNAIAVPFGYTSEFSESEVQYLGSSCFLATAGMWTQDSRNPSGWSLMPDLIRSSTTPPPSPLRRALSSSSFVFPEKTGSSNGGRRYTGPKTEERRMESIGCVRVSPSGPQEEEGDQKRRETKEEDDSSESPVSTTDPEAVDLIPKTSESLPKVDLDPEASESLPEVDLAPKASESLPEVDLTPEASEDVPKVDLTPEGSEGLPELTWRLPRPQRTPDLCQVSPQKESLRKPDLCQEALRKESEGKEVANGGVDEGVGDPSEYAQLCRVGCDLRRIADQFELDNAKMTGKGEEMALRVALPVSFSKCVSASILFFLWWRIFNKFR